MYSFVSCHVFKCVLFLFCITPKKKRAAFFYQRQNTIEFMVVIVRCTRLPILSTFLCLSWTQHESRRLLYVKRRKSTVARTTHWMPFKCIAFDTSHSPHTHTLGHTMGNFQSWCVHVHSVSMAFVFSFRPSVRMVCWSDNIYAKYLIPIKQFQWL